MTVVATFYAIVLLPDSLLRLALWVVSHTIYSIRVEGRDNIPERGAALFVADDLSLPGRHAARRLHRPAHPVFIRKAEMTKGKASFLERNRTDYAFPAACRGWRRQ